MYCYMDKNWFDKKKKKSYLFRQICVSEDIYQISTHIPMQQNQELIRWCGDIHFPLKTLF